MTLALLRLYLVGLVFVFGLCTSLYIYGRDEEDTFAEFWIPIAAVSVLWPLVLLLLVIAVIWSEMDDL